MVLIFHEGFEGVNNTSGNSVRVAVTEELSRKMTVKRVAAQEPFLRDGETQGKALSFGDGNQADVVTLSMPIGQNIHNTEVIVGFRIKLRDHTAGGLQQEVARIFASRLIAGERQLELVIDYNDANKLSIRRQGTVLETESSGTLLSNTWHFIEWKFLIHNTAGSWTVRIDDTQVLNGSSTDTQGVTGGSGTIGEQANLLAFLGAEGTGGGVDEEFLIDDIYVITTAGSVNNNFLGANTRTHLLLPNAEGTTITWVPQSGTDNSAMIDEVPASDTDYNDGQTNTNVDDYTFPDTQQETIYGVKIESHVKTDTGGRQRTFRHRARSGATIGNGSDIPVAGDEIVSELFELDPNTSALWTMSGLNAAEFGVEVRD
jgi:hypothetical protein